MKPTRKTCLLLATAATQALLASLASAQLQATGQDGRAMDANNRVGSGGFNQPSGQIGVTPNQIVYGNVTGGKEFRGPVGSRDPGAFTGPSAGRLVDRFVAGSSGVPTSYQPQVDLTTAQPFYGMSRNAPPPVGSVRLGYTGSYLGTNPAGNNNDYNLTAQYAAADDQLTQRLGVSQVLGTRSTLVGTSSFGESYLQPVNPDNQNTAFSGSALYGIQPLRSNLEDQQLDATGQGAGLLAGPGDRFRVDSAQMRRMRTELENPADQNQQQNNNPNAQGQNGFGQSLNANDNTQSNNTPGFSNDLQSGGQGTQRRYTIVAPDLQSSQYREMRQRLSQYENPQFAQMEAQHRARMERQAIARRAAGATSQPAAPTGVGINPDAVAQASIRQPGAASAAGEPMKVTSLATGVRAKGLHDMLASAEDLMKQGKFQSAIDRYDIALQIAPNNPLVSLGRANAELGAGADRLATADLHRVFSSDHATLMAQYDIKSWFPPERLSAIQKELEDLSSRDPKDEMPEFLLTYIAYNTGNPDDAARHLTEAKKRSATTDPLLDFIERDWKLPTVERTQAPQPELNKQPDPTKLPDINK